MIRRATARATALLAICALVSVAGLASAGGSVTGSASGTGVATSSQSRSRIIAADGVKQWLWCAGHGPVTVVVIPGLHATHGMWRDVIGSFASTTRTCIYDRPGLGPSPPRRPHRTVSAATHAAELWALLRTAGELGPYVVVGHSYGGLIARAFVAAHPTSTSGLMLVEGSSPQDAHSGYWSEGGDLIGLASSAKAAAKMQLHGRRLVVESAADPDRDRWGGPSYGETAANLARWRANQAAASHLSSDATWVIVAGSAHIIELDRPGAVIDGVRTLVAAIKTHAKLSPCALLRWGRQPRCVHRISGVAVPATIVLGGVTTLRGSVTYPGMLTAGQSVVVQQRIGRTWRSLGYPRVNPTGHWSLTIRPTSRGVLVLHAWKPPAGCSGTRCTIPGSLSGTFVVTVR